MNQNSDRLPLAEALAAMERLGTSEDARIGYEDGYKGRYSPRRGRNRSASYERGAKAGRLAKERGAHPPDAVDRFCGGGRRNELARLALRRRR